MSAPLRTPLYDQHLRLGARMMAFGGWEMPLQYEGIMAEHETVRNDVGLFDISHMGQIHVCGGKALDWLDGLLASPVRQLGPGQGQYSFLLNREGGVIDDLYIYRTGALDFLLVVNASHTNDDLDWLSKHDDGRAEIEQESAGGIAVQGPRAQDLLACALGPHIPLPARNRIARVGSILVARTGYTGEDGFELFLPAEETSLVWTALLQKGASLGAKPCGLGARDTLRLEMCYPLNGSDLSPARTPLEAGLGGFVDLAKPEYPGQAALHRQKADGIRERLAAFRMTEKSPPPRSHYPLLHEGKPVGEVASGTMSPSLGCGIGMAYVPAGLPAGTPVEILIRGKRFPAKLEKKPLYQKP